MSRITNDIIKSLQKSLQANDRKTSAYDTQATIRRIDGNTAWVHIPGGVDETPVQLTINASVGDRVQVRVSGGRAFLVGNATAPPTDNAYARQVNRTLTQEIQTTNTVLGGVKKVVQTVKKIADNTNQYFWHTEEGTDTGAHITEIPQEDFLADPENGGGNLLARSNGIAVRDGLTELARFSASETQIGADADKNIQIDQSSVRFNDGTNQIAGIYSTDRTLETVRTTGTDFALVGERNSTTGQWDTPQRIVMTGRLYQDLTDDSFGEDGTIEVVADNEQDATRSARACIYFQAYDTGQTSLKLELQHGSTTRYFTLDSRDGVEDQIMTNFNRIKLDGGGITSAGFSFPCVLPWTFSNQTVTANTRGTISNLPISGLPSGAQIHGVVVTRTPNNHWVRAYAYAQDNTKIAINYVNENSGAIAGAFSVLIFFTL